MKRGLSPIVGVVILISLILAIGVGIFLWGGNLFGKAGSEALADKTCSELDFEVDDFCKEVMNVENIETGISKPETRIKFNGRNNLENSVLIGFLFSLDYDGEIIPYSTLEYNSELEGGETKTLFTDFIVNSGDVKQISIYARIKINNKIITCEKEAETINWEDVEQC